MKRFLLKRDGNSGCEAIAEECKTPTPSAGEVLVKIEACSLNYRDLLVKSGLSASGGGGDVVPLSDGAGVIAQVGEGVTKWQEGDGVALTFFRDWEDGPFETRYHQAARGGSCDGVLAEYVTAPAHSIVQVPKHLTTLEASTLPCAALTAWHALMERTRSVQKGDTVLCLGTGGVSVFALQIAKAAGAKVIITSSSDEKLSRAGELGVDETINYREHEAWDKQVRELTGGCGADYVIEVGGPGTLERSLNSVAAGGVIYQIGVLTGFDPPQVSLFPLVTHNADINGIYVGSRAMFGRMNAFLSGHDIHPVINEEYSFGDALKAYASMEASRHFGKIVVKV